MIPEMVDCVGEKLFFNTVSFADLLSTSLCKPPTSIP